MLSKKTVITTIGALYLLLAGNGCLYMFIDLKPDKGTYFPHETHTGALASIKGNEGCLECHAGMKDSKTTDEWLMPTKKICANCHDDPKFYGKVKFRPATGSLISFNHNKHVVENELKCIACHKTVVTKEYLPPRGGFPSMKVCGDCHGDWLPNPETPQTALKNICQKCHRDAESMKPRNHYENWMEMHRTLATGQWKESCATCHSDKKSCTKCHAGGFFRPESHDLSFVETHKHTVRNTVQNCKSCHSDDFCTDCHRISGVAGTVKYKQRYDIGIHPAGWISDVPNTGNHHSVTARFKLDTCKTCHVAGDCRSCHFKRFPYGR